jgi:outer membrane protein OmpA-like peptidoglycan-associated protein
VHSLTGMRRFVAVAGSLAVMATMAGCADKSEPTGGLAIVVGARSNMPAPSLDATANDALETAVLSQSYLSVVVADGAPFEVQGGPLSADDTNQQVQNRDRERNRQLVRTTIAEAAAKTPETDLLRALDLAARAISGESGAHTIVVVDSGLSTVAPLDFTQAGLLDADPTELATSLKVTGQLPDLAGVDVVFQGLGDTALPQEPIGRAQRTNLIGIWQAVVEAAGGHGQSEDAPLSGDAIPGLPSVTPVPPGADFQCTAGTVVLTGGDVAFQPNSADFVDPAAAGEILRPIAAQMVDAQLTATVTGTTARVNDLEGQRELSRERAQAVADALTSQGVPSASLTVVGLGSEFPDYVQDHDSNGALIPGAAAENRKVVIQLAGASADVTCTLG